jgi:aspartate aminotransferase
VTHATANTAYGSAAGSETLRAAVAGYYTRRGIETEPDQIVVGPGSKALLYGLLAVLDGDVVLPRPAWVSYEPQARLLRKAVVRVDIPGAVGGVPNPEALRVAVMQARRERLDPRILVLTHPDNPTGTFADAALLVDVLATARECGLFVISDEIYGELAYSLESFVSAGRVAPDDVVITGGLSKSHALGGWRVGTMRVPATDIGRRLAKNVTAVASEIWSCLSAPIEAAAIVAYRDPDELVEFVSKARTLHASVSEAVYGIVRSAGVDCRAPTAAFYLYPDFGPLHERLEARNITTGTSLAEFLLEQFGIAVLPGAAFGDPEGLRLRLSTSLLYGRTEAERWAALNSASSAAELPWVDSSLCALASALAEI